MIGQLSAAILLAVLLVIAVGLAVICLLAIIGGCKAWAADREREKEYADEWVRTHRAQRAGSPVPDDRTEA